MSDRLIYSLPLLLRAHRARSYRERTMEKARVLLEFLENNHLLASPLRRAGDPLPPDLVIMESHLSDRGQEVMRRGLERWLAACDRGTAPSKSAILQKALEALEN